eukprot:c10125_g1_i1.p1 GENE.c10125_g1_i1~~c10125_g1_i1.p1  ORF type:complete len:263 (+),score=50.73 c10125_g1_i1:110-898(+)
MTKNSSCLLSFLVAYIVVALIAMGCGAAAQQIAVFPRPGSWWPILIGLPTFGLGFPYAHKSQNECIRVTFIVVGVFAVVLTGLGGIIDSVGSSVGGSANVCIPYNDLPTVDEWKRDCCVFEQNVGGNTTRNSMCESEDQTTNTCLCCYFDASNSENTDEFTWKVRGSCNQIPHRLANLLAASASLHFISAVLLIVALSISCCRCCGPVSTSSPEVPTVTATTVHQVPMTATTILTTHPTHTTFVLDDAPTTYPYPYPPANKL